MFSRIVPIAARTAGRNSASASAAAVRPSAYSRGYAATVGEAITAGDAAELSGYNKIDFSINEDAFVIDAVQKFAAFNIGCLVTTNAEGEFSMLLMYTVLTTDTTTLFVLVVSLFCHFY